MIEREWYVQLQLLWKLKSLPSTYSWPKSYEKFCAWISQFTAGGYYDHVLLGWNWKVFIFWLSTTINCPRSRLKHPPTSADFQSRQITCSFICFPIMERHYLSITSFVLLRILDIWVKALIDFVQLCEVFVLVFLCSYTAYEQVEGINNRAGP